jgi:hypothetical protein
MAQSSMSSKYKNRRRIVVVLGVLLLLGGIAVGLLAPLEMYCFYLFSDGGRFAYSGFGFGSFMFANIAGQIVGYYMIAAILIPLGYGHIKLRSWTPVLAQTLAWVWLVIGAPLVILAAFVLLGSKQLSFPIALAALVVLALSYLVLPWLAVLFYRGEDVRRTFAAGDPGPHRIEQIPQPLLVLASLFFFFAVMMHLLILFNGIFPAMGVLVFGMPGIALIDVSIACWLCLAWGTLGGKRWAWWGAAIVWGLFTISLWVTFLGAGYAEILSGLAFPAREVDILDGLPLQGFHIAVLAGVPCLITWFLAVSSRRYFR